MEILLLFFFIVFAIICIGCITFLMLTKHDKTLKEYDDDNSIGEYDWRGFKNHN